MPGPAAGALGFVAPLGEAVAPEGGVAPLAAEAVCADAAAGGVAPAGAGDVDPIATVGAGVGLAAVGSVKEAPDTVAAIVAPCVRVVVTGVPARVGGDAVAADPVTPPCCAASRGPVFVPTGFPVLLPVPVGCWIRTCNGGPVPVTCNCKIVLTGIDAGNGVGVVTCTGPCGVFSVICPGVRAARVPVTVDPTCCNRAATEGGGEGIEPGVDVPPAPPEPPPLFALTVTVVAGGGGEPDGPPVPPEPLALLAPPPVVVGGGFEPDEPPAPPETFPLFAPPAPVVAVTPVPACGGIPEPVGGIGVLMTVRLFLSG